jgi:hypothetical protein
MMRRTSANLTALIQTKLLHNMCVTWCCYDVELQRKQKRANQWGEQQGAAAGKAMR